jgi:PAS domain S-box-containing protein
MIAVEDLLQAVPMAVYMTDAEGRITFYNDAAAEFWGYRPEIGSAQWCGSWRLFRSDGQPMAHDECPMAVALKEGRVIRDVEAIAERPDGSRIPFVPYPTPLKDGNGRVVGAINLLVDVAERSRTEIESARLAAIVTSSDDAIISKTLDGTITSWNEGAARIFGYEASEMIGAPITNIIPPELHPEEQEILARLKRGERIDHFETVRITKDGRRLDISLTVSPVRNRAGVVIGASKVARDITERRRSDELQKLLFNELNHRVKNTLATIQALASQSLRRAASPTDFVRSFNGRVEALARAHDLLVSGKMAGADVMAIVREQVVLGTPEGSRVSCAGPRLILDGQVAVQLGLVLHELATNARKYGALSVPTGRLAITWRLQVAEGREMILEWRESGVPDVQAPATHGFGTTLIKRTLESNGGEAVLRYGADGVACDIRLPLFDQPETGALDHRPSRREDEPSNGTAVETRLSGRRILVVEDEPLVALDLEEQLSAAGCEIVGPAGTIESARKLIATAAFDAALLDANLAGHPVDALASELAQKGVPFAFATGYGREALPPAFRQSPLLAKPFAAGQLLAVMSALMAGRTG